MSEKKVLDAATHGTVMGRHVVDEDGSVKFDWPGVRLKFDDVTGTTSIAVRIEKISGSVLGYSVTEKSDDMTPEEKVIPTNIFTPIANLLFKDHMLASDLDAAKSYEVVLWKRDDPALCSIAGLVVDENATASAKVVTSKKHIEFVGDADVIGFGNMGALSGKFQFIVFQSWSKGLLKEIREATDASKSWAAHVAAGVDNADYSIIAWSARGAKHSPFGFTNMINLYPRVLATDKKTAEEGNLGPADAVVVYIGQDDITELGDLGRLSKEHLSEGYEELLHLIRKHRPAPIPIIAVSPTLDAMVSRVESEAVRRETCKMQHKVWKALIEKLGGKEAGFYFIENQHEPQIELNSPEDYGMCLHWNAASDKKWADGLSPAVSKIVGGASK